MTSPLKVGVFGVGSLGRHHARIYSELKQTHLVGVYDTDLGRARKVARATRCEAFDSPEALAACIEAASVVVPTDKHLAVALPLLERGIHLLVEKPIAASTAEAEKLVAMAGKRKVILQVGHVERFNPVMSFIETHLSNPRFIEATRIAPYPPRRPDGGPPRGTEVSVVLDLMIHDLEIILHLVQAPVTGVHAVGVPVLSASEDIANVRLNFENGCVANVTASRISRDKIRKIRLFQEDTYVSLDYMNQAGMMIRKVGNTIRPTPIPLEKRQPLEAELEAFADCVIHRGTPVVTGEHAANALKLAVDICQAIRTHPS